VLFRSVTDHHEPKGAPPAEAVAVIDPKLPGCDYPENTLAGVGVAMKLGQALCGALGSDAAAWQDYLDLVALGTAADIVPLTGENRILVAHGLRLLSDTANAGLRALIREQGLEGKQLETHHLVFQLAPSINAAGRLGDSSRAVEMLLTENHEEAAAYARELVQTNRERRALNEQVEEEAVAWVCEHCDPERDMAFVAGSAAWHQGVVGIVASKLVERFYRPAILFSIVDGMAHGSGRTIPSLHLFDALSECEDLLEGYGGHAAAVGVRLHASRLEQLRERFNQIVRTRITPEDLTPTITVDAEIPLSELSPKVFRIIERMRPFGPGNMRPILLARDLKHARTPRIVGKNHLKLSISAKKGIVDAIGFGFGDRIADLPCDGRFSLAFCMDENEWNGRKALQMLIKGVAA
jgi:single-stranded-DNA-specific exonuclease